MAQVGLIARMDLGSGLQAQTYNICRMIRPSKVLVVDSTPFNGARQSPVLYDGFNAFYSKGFPTFRDTTTFLTGLSHTITCETMYNSAFYGLARARGVKTFCQPNPEFSDTFAGRSHDHPTTYLLPSPWFEQEWKAKMPNSIYLPPPFFASDFKNARNANFQRRGNRKFLCVVGKLASADRNGTLSVVEALKHCKADFQLTIKSQYELPQEYKTDDPRVTYDIRNVPVQEELYTDYDFLLYPRRYGGLAMPLPEALLSGLPVIMTDISPNNQLLPSDWLVPARSIDKLMTRIELDVYSADIERLANKIDMLAECSETALGHMKTEAFQIGYDHYSSDVLKPKYQELFV